MRMVRIAVVLLSMLAVTGCHGLSHAQAPLPVDHAPDLPTSTVEDRTPAPTSDGAPQSAAPDEAAAASTWQRLTRLSLPGAGLWADELFFHEWRIQRNPITGSYRLVDGQYERFASGTFDDCRQQLDRIRQQQQLSPMDGTAVILLHGLGGFPATMAPLASHLRHHGSYTILNMSYPSTRGELSDHARALASVVAHLDGIDEIHLVGHSLGNLVIRYYLGRTDDQGMPLGVDPRIGRIVMIAPPNHGAELAEYWSENRLYRAATGNAGQQLGPGFAEIAGKLATPAGEFGIIAGGRGDDAGYSDALPGDDDGLLTVATTRLAGASDFAVLPSRHNLLLLNETVYRYTLSFLENGYFRTADDRQPVSSETGPK